jgi:tetratricopeptide (TPR) repeat protein
MVSGSRFFSSAAFAATSLLLAQQPADTPLPFADTNRTGSTITPREPAPKQTLTPEMRGDILMARKMYREAIEVYSQANVNTPVIANKIGIAYHQMVELDLARKQYQRAIKLDPKYSEAINNLGTVHYARKGYRRAIGQYKKALKLSPASASIHSNLGTAYFARKKYKDAAEAYEKALELDPEVFERRNSHGVLLQERNIQERAKFHYYLSKTYAKAGAIERALLYMRKSLEEGFKDRQKFREEPEFAQLQENAEFQKLLVLEPRVL